MKVLHAFVVCTTLGLVTCALSACTSAEDYLSSINPFSKKEAPLPGERRSVLPNDTVAVPAPDLVQSQPPNLPQAQLIAEWLNPGGPPSNAPGNIALRGGARSAWAAAGTKGGRTLSPPLVVNNRVVVYNGRYVSAYDFESGRLLWVVDANPRGTNGITPGGGIASDGNIIYVATGLRALVALDANSGHQIWSQTLNEPARSAPTVADGKIYVVTAGSAVYAYSTSTGQDVWRYVSKQVSGGLLSATSPAVLGNLIVVPFASGEILGLNAATGALEWSNSLIKGDAIESVSSLNDVAGRPVAHGGMVYAGSVAGRFVAINAATGATIWEKNIPTAHAPIAAGDVVYVLGLAGQIFALDHTTGNIRFTAQLPTTGKRTVWAGPLLANDHLWVIASGGLLVSVDARTGQIASQNSISEGSNLSPVAASGKLIIASSSGGLIAIE